MKKEIQVLSAIRKITEEVEEREREQEGLRKREKKGKTARESKIERDIINKELCGYNNIFQLYRIR